MGPKGSKPETDLLLADFQVVKRVDTEGLLHLIHRTTRKEYILRELTFNDKKEFQKCVTSLELKKGQLSGCKFLVPLERVVSKAEDQYCSTFYKVYALFESGERTLDQEIGQRRAQGRKFAENQLWSIIASCILGLAHLQKNGIRHEALRSGVILISKEGVVRVYDPATTGIISNFQALSTRRGTGHLYLSPQLSQSLQQETTGQGINPYKADIFTLGVIILQAGLLQYQDECYRDDCTRLHWETLQYSIHRFRQTYSEDLTGLVELMLSREEKQRPDWLQLEERVIREEENKTVSLLNISRDSTGPQQGRASGAPFITSQVVPIYQSNQQKNILPPTSASQRHSHLYRAKPINPQPIPASQSGFIPHHTHTNSDVSSSRYPSSSYPLDQSARIIPIAPSYIQPTRPLRSIFPASKYTTLTVIDENLIVVPEQQRGFEAETPNARNNSGYFQSNLKSAAESSLPVHHAPMYHTYTPPPPSNAVQTPMVNTYGVSFFPSQSPPQPPTIRSPPPPPSCSQGEYVVQRYKQGSEYKGYKVEGMRHGHGVFYYQDGGMYQGEWRYNKMQGRGKLYYQSGKLAYQGQWANDQFSGEGVLYNEYPDVLHEPINYKNLDQIEEFWTKYEGHFTQDLKNGQGILFLSNGEYYQGQFRQDMASGQGKFHRLDGQVISGRWLNNLFVG